MTGPSKPLTPTELDAMVAALYLTKPKDQTQALWRRTRAEVVLRKYLDATQAVEPGLREAALAALKADRVNIDTLTVESIIETYASRLMQAYPNERDEFARERDDLLLWWAARSSSAPAELEAERLAAALRELDLADMAHKPWADAMPDHRDYYLAKAAPIAAAYSAARLTSSPENPE
jgi:hypothetical protein